MMESAYPVLTDHDDGVRLAGFACRHCGHIAFPERPILCPRCERDEFEDRPFGREGVVWAYTIVRHRPPGYFGQLPYALAIVELPEGCRIESIIEAPDPGAVRIGDRVALIELEVPVDEEGHTWTTYAYTRGTPS